MLKKIFTFLCLILALFPILLYLSMTLEGHKGFTSDIEGKIITMIEDCFRVYTGNPDDSPIPDVDPPIRCEPFPRRYAAWLKFQSPNTLRELFGDFFEALKLPEEQEHSDLTMLRWRIIVNGVKSELLFHGFEALLLKGDLSGLDAYLNLPGVYYLKNNREGERPPSDRDWFQEKQYQGRPYFLGPKGFQVLSRLLSVSDQGMKRKISKKMNRALKDWTSDSMLPWLPLAYLSAFPKEASAEVVESYLRGVLDSKPRPYLPNCALLFLHISDHNRIIRLMEELKPYGDRTRNKYLQRQGLGDPAFLYWFMCGSAEAVCAQPVISALQVFESPTKKHPPDFYLLKELWHGVNRYVRNVRDVFYDESQMLYAQVTALSEGAGPHYWDLVLAFPLIHGHCFMAFGDLDF